MSSIALIVMSLFFGKLLTFRLAIYDAANRMADRHRLRPSAAARIEADIMPRSVKVLIVGAICVEMAVFSAFCRADCLWSASYKTAITVLVALLAHKYLGPTRASPFWLKLIRTSLHHRLRPGGDGRVPEFNRISRRLLQQFDEALIAR